MSNGININMDDVELTKHLLAGDGCKNCIYTSLSSKVPASVYCVLEGTHYDTERIMSSDICNNYTSDNILLNKSNRTLTDVIRNIRLLTYSDVDKLVSIMENYK